MVFQNISKLFLFKRSTLTMQPIQFKGQIRSYFTTEEQKISIKGQIINYVKVGNGDKIILALPGALGTIWSDFKPQINLLDKTKFTVVAWDPPGYGNSRPPERKFTTNFYENDADAAFDLMKKLNVAKYSLLGWSDGGITALILAAKYPEVINKLIVWGASAYLIEEDIKNYEKKYPCIWDINSPDYHNRDVKDLAWEQICKEVFNDWETYTDKTNKNIRDVSKWSKKMKDPLIEMYTENGLQNLWNGWCDTLTKIYNQGGDICISSLDKIKCPTFILHGDKDPMVPNEHPEFLLAKIKGAKLHRFSDGKHNIHLRYADEFNQLVTDFLLK